MQKNLSTPKIPLFTPFYLTKTVKDVIKEVRIKGGRRIMTSDKKLAPGNDKGGIEVIIKLVKLIVDLFTP